jgi:hypothetical protein
MSRLGPPGPVLGAGAPDLVGFPHELGGPGPEPLCLVPDSSDADNAL